MVSGKVRDSLPDGIKSIGDSAFSSCTHITHITFPSSLTSIGAGAFQLCDRLIEVTFKGKPTTIPTSTFTFSTALATVNVPWAEGEVKNAPWGATNATINYNYVEGA